MDTDDAVPAGSWKAAPYAYGDFYQSWSTGTDPMTFRGARWCRLTRSRLPLNVVDLILTFLVSMKSCRNVWVVTLWRRNICRLVVLDRWLWTTSR